MVRCRSTKKMSLREFKKGGLNVYWGLLAMLTISVRLYGWGKRFKI